MDAHRSRPSCARHRADRSLVDRLATFPGRTYTLLVGAIRRAAELALAMDARGFGSRPCRTLARPRSFGRGDVALVLGALALAIGATVARVVIAL